MDEMLSKAVKEAFVRMHADGLVYRDNRLVNWCCRLKTAISDIEVDYVDLDGSKEMSVPGQDGKVEFGSIWSFAYPIEGGGEIVVATTRPETMLGDTAVAVHPDDARYKDVQGKHVVHPFNGRKIPIICDAELVDMSFGTGAVKITPAHDPNDFQTGKRHNLEFINMLTEEGMINDEGGDRFKGMKRFAARPRSSPPSTSSASTAVRRITPCASACAPAPRTSSSRCSSRSGGSRAIRWPRRLATPRDPRSSRSFPTSWSPPGSGGSRTSATGASRDSCGGGTESRVLRQVRRRG